MDVFDWVRTCRQEYRRSGDEKRFELTDFRRRGYALRETDPDGYLALLREGRNLAESLGEPWWRLFYDAFSVEVLLVHKHDYTQGIDLATQLALEVRKPIYAGFPGRFVAYNMILNAYLGVDPWGYEKPIAELLDYLDGEIPPGPNADRLVCWSLRRDFHIDREDFEGARELALGHLAQIPEAEKHYRRGVFFDLSLVSERQGRWDELDEYAAMTAQLAEKATLETLGAAHLWRALVARVRGDEATAQRYFRHAWRRFDQLGKRPGSYVCEIQVAYHGAAGAWEKAMEVQRATIARLEPQGQHARTADLKIGLCRLAKRMGNLDAALIADAEASFAKLLKPQKYRAKLRAIVGDC